jgi:hypothetical protein
MIHYHGTPINPRSEMYKMAGKHFCVSMSDPRYSDLCLQIGQSVMWDNGAFSVYTLGAAPDWHAFYDWTEPRLAPPHWAVVPDLIDGQPDDNIALAEAWPHRRDCAGVVWHLAEPLAQIGRLLDLGFGRLCFGSSGTYWQIGSATWERRCDEAFDWIARRGDIPWVHMLRGLDMAGDRWPFASADSANVARNFSTAQMCPERMARRIDAVQCPVAWIPRATQMELIDANDL